MEEEEKVLTFNELVKKIDNYNNDIEQNEIDLLYTSSIEEY